MRHKTFPSVETKYPPATQEMWRNKLICHKYFALHHFGEIEDTEKSIKD